MYWNFHKVQGLSRSRPLTNWGNLPSKLDAIMDFDDQTTYMVKGDQYWSFNEDILRVRVSKRFWII